MNTEGIEIGPDCKGIIKDYLIQLCHTKKYEKVTRQIKRVVKERNQKIWYVYDLGMRGNVLRCINPSERKTTVGSDFQDGTYEWMVIHRL